MCKSTAAPKKRAHAKIKVVNDETETVIAGAEVEIWSQRLGKTGKNGVYTTKSFLEGDYDLKVRKKGFGPVPAPGTKVMEGEYVSHEIFEPATYKKPENKFIVRLRQAQPRAIVTVLDKLRSDAPIHGVGIEITSKKAGVTKANGICVTEPFEAGRWHVKLRKPGYTPAPAEYWEDFPDPVEKKLVYYLEGQWGRVKNSNITVKGMPFEKWFNSDFLKRPNVESAKDPEDADKKPKDQRKLFTANIYNTGSFKNVFDNIGKLWAPEVTLEEFLGLFLIFYNETGGGFTPKAEVGELKYFFEPGKHKSSYNSKCQVLAGTKLRAEGKITTDEEEKIWNGNVWPNPPVGSDLYNAAIECDFNKFRGRGYNQITFRSNYIRFVEPALKAKGYGTLDSLTDAQLTEFILKDSDLNLTMTRNYFLAIKESFEKINEYDFVPVAYGIHNSKPTAYAVAGQNAHKYAQKFQNRFNMLFEEMTKEVFTLG